MKKILFLVLCFQSLLLSAQNNRRIGMTIGVNEYYAKPSFASARSGTGFSAGFVGGFRVTEASEILIEFNFIRFNMEFFAQDVHKDDPEWVKFHNNRIGGSLLYYYDLVHLMNNDLILGVHAGPSVTYINNYVAKGRDNEKYEIAPYDIFGQNMRISQYYEGSPFNTFAATGINLHYKKMELNLRYHFAISSPYRNLKFNNSPIAIDGKDDYLSVTFNYYFNK